MFQPLNSFKSRYSKILKPKCETIVVYMQTGHSTKCSLESVSQFSPILPSWFLPIYIFATCVSVSLQLSQTSNPNIELLSPTLSIQPRPNTWMHEHFQYTKIYGES